MDWFKKSIDKFRVHSSKKEEEEKLAEALNIKYGDYDYSQDARSFCGNEFENIFTKVLENYFSSRTSKPKVLVTGANSGYELPFLKGYDVVALDLSDQALRRLKSNYKDVEVVKANIENLPFVDKMFDAYISMRAIHSFNIDLEKALAESVRVTKNDGLLFYSISNAYVINNHLVKGMYMNESDTFDLEKPYTFVNKIKEYFSKIDYSLETVEIQSEIILLAKKHE